MRRVVVLFVLCLITTAELACSRRTARAVRLPSTSGIARDARHHNRATGDMRDAIESLKNKLRASREPDEPAPEGTPGAVSQAGDASNPATGVGTSGALSVETRYPAPNGTASQAPARTHALSRAGDAVRRAASGMSVWVVGVCALAAALIVALLMRRSNSSA